MILNINRQFDNARLRFEQGLNKVWTRFGQGLIHESYASFIWFKDYYASGSKYSKELFLEGSSQVRQSIC